MSVTFGCPDALAHEESRACDFPGCKPGDRCGYCQDGIEFERISDAPECNFCNENARNLLDLLDLPCDEPGLYGCVEVEDLAALRRRIMFLTNSEAKRAHLVTETQVIGGEKRVRSVLDGNVVRLERTSIGRVIRCGNTDDQTLRRLGQLDRLLEFAQVSGFRVTWG